MKRFIKSLVQFAKGKNCPMCGHYMYAISERIETMGNTVVYECRNTSCKFQEKVFES
jgi:transcription elongation factor Elf1